MKSSLGELSTSDMRSHLLPSTNQPGWDWMGVLEEVVMSMNIAMPIPRYTEGSELGTAGKAGGKPWIWTQEIEKP